MPKLILVRHSEPAMEASVPANQWRLSEEGRLRCYPLAQRLAEHQPHAIISSVEPKAHETAQIVADALDLPCEVAEGLHEHDRSNVGMLAKEEFETKVAGLFARPHLLVFGRETADQAHHRFAQAVQDLLQRYPDKNIAVVTHGTVLTLFVSRATGLEPLPLWKSLGLPTLVVLSLPELDLLSVEAV